MQMLWLMSIALAASACSREVVRCDGHLTAVNAAGTAAIGPSRGRGGVEAASAGGAEATGVGGAEATGVGGAQATSANAAAATSAGGAQATSADAPQATSALDIIHLKVPLAGPASVPGSAP